jgi:DNA-binding transcriptional ArsR family regulator
MYPVKNGEITSLVGDLLMSETRVNILDFLSKHGNSNEPVSANAIHDKLSNLYSLEPCAVSLALDDLRHLGLIEISAGAVTLTHLAVRLLR